MEVEQGLHNLGDMINSMHNTETVGSVHKAMMRSRFWALGLNPFQNEIPNITHDESIWPRTTAQFMSTHNIKIISDYPSYPLVRENDEYIMTQAYNLPFTAYALQYINYCRLLLNVTSIADLTDASVKFVNSEMYQIKRNTSKKSDSTCAQSAPQAFKMHFWHKYLSHITISKQRKLKVPLGRWIVTSDQIRQKYNAYWNSTDVYLRKEQGITRHKHNMTVITHKLKQVNEIPVNALPCVLNFRNQIVSDISDNFSGLSVSEDKTYTEEGIIAVTDASVIGERGTWAAIVTTRNGKELCRDQGVLTSRNLSNYRAELQGCKGALQLLNKFNKDTPKVLLCDNLSAIQSLNKIRSYFPSINQSDYDILLEVKELIQPTITFQHVKGHQGAELSDEFDLQTNLNILMDSRAKRMQQEAQHTSNWTYPSKYQIYTTMRSLMERLSRHFDKRLVVQECVFITKTSSKKIMTAFYGNHSPLHVKTVIQIREFSK
jgi:ribonuclease HI